MVNKIKKYLLIILIIFTGCTTPYATFRDGNLKASTGVIATWTVDKDKVIYTIDTTSHNWWSVVKDVANRMMDSVSGMAERTSVDVGGQ